MTNRSRDPGDAPIADGAAHDAGGQMQGPEQREALARLAHELRTPLAAISALSEVMRDERLGPVGDQRYRAYAADIHHSAQQALAVLASFLEAGERPDLGGGLSFAELQPEIETERSVSALRPVAAKAGVLLGAVHDVRLPRLIADRRSLRQILDNLIVNAIKFTPPGGRVRVYVRHVLNGPLEISVEDTGDGIAPPDLARILERCTAPEPDAPRRSGGGIGLPLVRVLANANGGELVIASERGRGTRVTVAFGRERLVMV